MVIEVFRAVVLYGGAESGPVGSSGVWNGKLRRFLASYCIVWHCNVLSGFLEHGIVSFGDSRCGAFFRGKVLNGLVLWGKAFQGVVLFCDVLLGCVGRIGVLHCRVRAYFDMDEALHSIVMLCPARHCNVSLGVFWKGGLQRCIVLRGSAGWCFVRFAGAFLRCRTVGSLGAAGQARPSRVRRCNEA